VTPNFTPDSLWLPRDIDRRLSTRRYSAYTNSVLRRLFGPYRPYAFNYRSNANESAPALESLHISPVGRPQYHRRN
jgi:hypothetical protein